MLNSFYHFYKENENDKIWQVDEIEKIDGNEISYVRGKLLYSFDKKKIYNLWTDYPWELTKEEKNLFDKENPYWADFFKDRV
ncbi:MAG: hypothetical protein RSC99_10035 [Clostridiales bacterium]